MLTGRRWLIVMGIVVLTLVGLGLWRRSQLIDEGAAARARRDRALTVLTTTRRVLAETSVTAGSIETATTQTRRSADELASVANALYGQIASVQRERDDDALNAWITGGQVSQLRDCLAGITRALNEVSVGDPQATATLATVRTACRAVGG